MSNMCIEVEFLAGTSIEDAAQEAIEKAAIFDVAYIQFDFNGMSMSVGRHATPNAVSAAFHKALKSEHKFAVVNREKTNDKT